MCQKQTIFGESNKNVFSVQLKCNNNNFLFGGVMVDKALHTSHIRCLCLMSTNYEVGGTIFFSVKLPSIKFHEDLVIISAVVVRVRTEEWVE